MSCAVLVINESYYDRKFGTFCMLILPLLLLVFIVLSLFSYFVDCLLMFYGSQSEEQ